MNNRKAEKMKEVYECYGYRCFICGSPANQLAHILGNTLANKSKYGKEIIDSPFNILPTCGLAHNALVDIGTSPVSSDQIAFHIENKNRFRIEEIVKENIHRKLNK